MLDINICYKIYSKCQYIKTINGMVMLSQGRQNEFQSEGTWLLRSGISLSEKVKHAIFNEKSGGAVLPGPQLWRLYTIDL